MTVALPADPPASSVLLDLHRSGSFTDCYALVVHCPVTLAQLVQAFYTSPWFKAERWVLKRFAAAPSTDQDVMHLASGQSDRFAVWRVVQRQADQVLLTERSGRTSSWLMVEPLSTEHGPSTRLYFGSAVTGRRNAQTGQVEFSRLFHALIGLHDFYSRRLLQAAAAKLMARNG